MAYVKRVFRLVFRSPIHLGNFVKVLAEVYGSQPALFLLKPVEYNFLNGDRVTYGQMGELVSRMASGLVSLGVKPGDRVAVCMSTRLEFLVAAWGALQAGAIVVPVNHLLRRQEVLHVLSDSAAGVLVADDEAAAISDLDDLNLPSLRIQVRLRDPVSGDRGGTGIEGVFGKRPSPLVDFRGLIEEGNPQQVPVSRSPRDPAVLMYTSGTTGKPKGALMSLAHASRGVAVMSRFLALMPRTGWSCGFLAHPLGQVQGFQMAAIYFATGRPFVLAPKFDPITFLDCVDRFRVTFFMGVPAMFAMAARAGLGHNRRLPSMKLWMSGGDYLSPELVRVLKKAGGWHLGRLRIPPVVLDTYGAVEAGMLVKPYVFGLRYPPGCVGWPVGVRVTVVDEQGNPVPKGQVGELVIGGEASIKSYWNLPEESARSFTPYGFCTGDMGRIGRWGLVYMTGRKKDMIKTGGYSVFAAEVEHALREHPAVREAAVVGRPHPTMGEVPVAVVTLAQGAQASAEELVAWVAQRVAPFKAPRQVAIVSEMPYRTSWFKIDKDALRSRLHELFPTEGTRKDVVAQRLPREGA